MKDFSKDQWYIVLGLASVAIAAITLYMMMKENPVVLVLITAIVAIALVMSSRNLLTASLISNDVIGRNRRGQGGLGYQEVENNYYGNGPEMNIEGVPMLTSSEPLARIAMQEYSDYADFEL